MASPSDMPAAAQDPASGLAVLVVDDEPVVAQQLAEGLAAFGFRASPVNSAAEAMACLAAGPDIGVVVTDIRMPGIDGLSLAQDIIASHPDALATEVVMITGHATVEDAAKAVRARVFDFLRKPFRLAEAVDAVSAAMARAQSRRRDAAARSAEAGRLAALENQRAALQQRVGEVAGQLALQPPPEAVGRLLERELRAVSHALRTPLVAISGGADLLAFEGGKPADESEYLGILREGVQRAVEAVELVEELHRVERPAAADAPGALRLAQAVARVVVQLDPMAQAKSIRLQVPATLPDVSANGITWRLRRSVELAVGAALAWAPAGSQVQVGLVGAVEDGRPWSVMTVTAGPVEKPVQPPAGRAFPDDGSVFARTQECLRFAIARRLAEQQGGQLTSWNGGEGRMAIRLALPA